MALSGISPVAQFLNAKKDEDSAASTYMKTNISGQRMVSDFRNKSSSITSAKQLMDDYSSNQVVLGAYNLGQLQNQKAVETQLLTQNPTDSKSLAKTSSNGAWMSFADAFKTMGENKGAADSTPFTEDFVNSTVSSYEKRQYETSDDLKKSGVGDALYYSRTMASGKIKTLNDIMSDSTLLRVVEVNNNLKPDEFGALDFDQQQRILKGKLDISKLTDSKNIDRNAEQYLTNLQVHPDYVSNDDSATTLDLFGGKDSDDIMSLFGDDSKNDITSLFK